MASVLDLACDTCPVSRWAPGHYHVYEYFGPQLHTSASDYAKDIRSVIVGAGGRSFTDLTGQPAANSPQADPACLRGAQADPAPQREDHRVQDHRGATLDVHSFGCH
jgi:hypothetical protein